MSPIEQAAVGIVLFIVSCFGLVTKWALKQKSIAEARAISEARKRIESEIRHDVESKSIDQLVDESNKRHGRE